MRLGALRVVAQHGFGDGARLLDQRFVFQVGVAQQGQAALTGTDEFAGAAQPQILAGDLEPVGNGVLVLSSRWSLLSPGETYQLN